jgi:Icc-related predicted phosphoesterase
MKVVCTSDLHGALPEIPECDLLLVGGDVCPDFMGGGNRPSRDHGAHEQAYWLGTKFRKWLNEVPAAQIVGIAGNHDFVFEHKFLVPLGLRWTYLEDTACDVAGLKIHGIPWVPNLPFWAFHARDEVLALAYQQIQPCDILLSHGPPYGFLDEAPSKYGSRAGENVGSKAAVLAIAKNRPSFFVCGHIHEGYGRTSHTYKRNTTHIINCAHMDGGYNPVNPPVVIDL